MDYEIIEKLKKEIQGFKDEDRFEEVGYVTDVGDGVMKISGLRNALSQELLVVETDFGNVDVLALNLEEDAIGAVAMGDFKKIKAGDEVRTTGRVASLAVGRELLGRVIDPLGKALDGKGDVFADAEKTEHFDIERRGPLVLERESVKIPLHTGIKAIDSMIPIGRGQRELIIGDRQTGKTAIALDAILNQKNDAGRRTAICIYVCIGQKESSIAKLIQVLERGGAMKHTIVLSAPASSAASLWYLAPYAGCAIGEYFMNQGEDVLIVFDDLTKHAAAYRQLSLLLRRPPGREAYPGDIFYLHSRLLERAAKLSPEKGGGSMTALPIIETQLGDVSSYVPTNVISITDGQIYLEADLFYQGVRPAVNAGLSVSRVGSSAQTKAMKKVAGKLRLELAQSRELQAFVQFSSDLDESTRKKIKKGRLITEILKQSDLAPIPFEFQVCILYAALHGHFDDLEIEAVRETEQKFTEYLATLHDDDILKSIRETNDLVPATEEKLKNAIQSFKNTLPQRK